MLIGLASFGTSLFSLLPVVCGELFGSENVKSGMAIIHVYQGLSIVVASFASGIIVFAVHLLLRICLCMDTFWSCSPNICH